MRLRDVLKNISSQFSFKFWRMAAIAFLISSIAAFNSAARAQVKPGDVIGPKDADKVKSLVGPGVLHKIKNGMTMKIIPPERIEWPPPFKDATEKYSAQVRLSPDHRSLVGYVAGQPFPLIDANDSDVAVKVMWNNVFRPITTDDYDLRFFDCTSAYTRPGKGENALTYFQVG